MSSKSTKKAKDKKITGDLKSKNSVGKLKKKKRNVADEKLNTEKKIKKLKEEKGKKSKLKKLKELLNQILKKEKKIASKLKESKKSKKGDKKSKKGKKPNETKDKGIGKIIAESIVPDESVISGSDQVEDNIEQVPNHRSTDQLAKEAIAHVRKLNDAKDIDLFVLGDKRITVLEAAESRKNSIGKS